MNAQVLITGGAGFIGSHLADALLRRGYRVRALDCLSQQVHGEGARRPAYLDPEVELIVGDVRDRDAVRRALDGVDAVFHLAAAVGVGQSMYEVAHYTGVNNLGTAVLLEALMERPVRRLVCASSMSLYGEGTYRGPDGEPAQPVERTLDRLRAGDWEVYDALGRVLEPLPTPETKAPALASVYALGKHDQEQMCLMIGRAYGIETSALRFFNVYGTRQALANPYTGVLAIFASRLLNGNRPAIFEDGLQRRDFVSVHDVARACPLALEHPAAVGEVFNVGSGRSFTVREIAERLGRAVGRPDVEPEVTAKYRVGDIRHCFADIGKATALLGYEPTVALDDGLAELASWLEGQVAEDRVVEASAELAARGLTVAATGTPAPSPNTVEKEAPMPVAASGRPDVRVVVDHDAVLITGGAGFVGANLAHRLLRDGRRVVVLDNFSRRGVERNVAWLRREHGGALEVVTADVRDADAVRAAVDRVSEVFHLAAQVAVTTSLDDPRLDFDVNARGTLNVLEALRAAKDAGREPALLFTSTNKVYGALDDVPLEQRGRRYEPADAGLRERGVSEERPLAFHSPYGCSKGAADQYVRDYARSFGLRTVVFRMSCIYGEHQFGTEDQGWIAHFLIRAIQGEPLRLYGDGMQVRDALYIDDLVDAMQRAIRAMDRVRGSAFNIGGGPARTTSLLDLLWSIRRLTGRAPATRWEAWRTGDQRYYVSDTRRFEQATGWSARVSLGDGLRRLHGWLLESGVAEPAADVAPRTERTDRTERTEHTERDVSTVALAPVADDVADAMLTPVMLAPEEPFGGEETTA
jgi:dTDP-L-rhamnose 4-epimerase